MVHAAFAGVPPVELFKIVQAGFAALKLSDNMVYGEAELDVADAFSAMVVPVQIAVSETEAVTPVGNGLTEAVTPVRVAEAQLVVVLRAAA